MMISSAIFASGCLVALANAHGYFQTPVARQPGPAYEAACGMAAYNQMVGDINGNIQNLEQNIAGEAGFDASKCDLWTCKGMLYADNTANVQTFSPGQNVSLFFNIRAPHTGYANVSIIDVSGGSSVAIGEPLITFDVYASNSVPLVPSQENFSVVIPTDLPSKCATAGNCAIQHFWNAQSINQTYESCIDFVISGSGSSASAAPSSPSSAPSVAASSAAASSPAAASTLGTASAASASSVVVNNTTSVAAVATQGVTSSVPEESCVIITSTIIVLSASAGTSPTTATVKALSTSAVATSAIATSSAATSAAATSAVDTSAVETSAVATSAPEESCAVVTSTITVVPTVVAVPSSASEEPCSDITITVTMPKPTETCAPITMTVTV